jgi:hypothetical protein
MEFADRDLNGSRDENVTRGTHCVNAVDHERFGGQDSIIPPEAGSPIFASPDSDVQTPPDG